MKKFWAPSPFPSKHRTAAGGQGITYGLGHPFLFHWLALLPVLALLLLGAFFHVTPLVATGVSVLALAGVSWLWSWFSIQKLSFHLALSKSRAFPGDKVDFNFRVTNHKTLFLNWLEIETELPHRLVTGKLRTPSPLVKERFRWMTSLFGGQQLDWTENIECKARGDYELGPVRLRTGDIFGFFPREIVLPLPQRLMVYPKVVPVDKLNLPWRELTGESVAPRSLYEDVSRTMGARDYRPDDPLKRIHWKASARHGQLLARQYESTTSLSLLLIFDIDSFCHLEKHKEERFELAVTTVASLANEACRQEFPVGLIGNSNPEIRIPTGAGQSQLLLLLEALARVEAKSQSSLQQGLEQVRGCLSQGATVAVVMAQLSPSISALVGQLEREGYALTTVTVDDEALVWSLGHIPLVPVTARREAFDRFQRATS